MTEREVKGHRTARVRGNECRTGRRIQQGNTSNQGRGSNGSSGQHVGEFRDADADDRPGENERARDEFGRVVHLERRSGLKVVLGPRNVRVVVADEERFARLGEQTRREEKADTAQRRESSSQRAKDLYRE